MMLKEQKAETWDCVLEAPGFCLGVRTQGECLAEIAFLPPQPVQMPHTALGREAVQQLQAWLKDAAFQFNLPLVVEGTPYRQAVWQQIAAIPRGETRTYGQLATALGSSPRAVGQACGDNPFPIIVPCHRVVAAGGKLGGFAHNQGDYLAGVKTWLLAHERQG